jgi:hypothetical protein
MFFTLLAIPFRLSPSFLPSAEALTTFRAQCRGWCELCGLLLLMALSGAGFLALAHDTAALGGFVAAGSIPALLLLAMWRTHWQLSPEDPRIFHLEWRAASPAISTYHRAITAGPFRRAPVRAEVRMFELLQQLEALEAQITAR